MTSAPVSIQNVPGYPLWQRVTDQNSSLSETGCKIKLLSGCSGDSFMDEIFFNLHICWKCLFFPNFLQIMPFAGYTWMSWLGLFQHLGHFVCWDWQLPRSVHDTFLTGLLDILTVSIGICLVLPPWGQTCWWWTVSSCRSIVTAYPGWDQCPPLAVPTICYYECLLSFCL